MSEGLESAQWFRHLLTEAHMTRSSLKNVEKESLKRPAIVFTDSESLANTVRQEVKNRRVHAPRRIRRSGEYIAAVVADTLASCRSSDEDDGKGHPRLILQQSCVSTCGQGDLCKQNSHRKCLGATELGPGRLRPAFVTELGPSELGPTDLGPVLSFKG